MGKTLTLGTRLRYPIVITKLLKSRGDTVKKQETVLEYSFKWMKEVGDHLSGNTWKEEQTTIASWESPVNGKLIRWQLREGDAVHKDLACMEVEETCGHEMQFHGMCAYCGEDMTEINWASDQVDTHRATVNMTHDQTGLMVSNELATRAEHDAQRRLLSQRKLSLVVDLDQTIIHACIEPTVGEWMNDPSNPNYEAVKHVRKFQLNDEGPRGPVTSTCWYYIKMRPGLMQFLEAVSELYELHVYTMGTRAYALNIAKIVDPQQKLFGNRVISRDENGSMISKDLHRLFPASTNMVVIIDDRADVWPRNRPNLIKVVPYDFFKGIGDINSSFLPKRTDILPTPPSSVTNGKAPTDASPDPDSNDASTPPATTDTADATPPSAPLNAPNTIAPPSAAPAAPATPAATPPSTASPSDDKPSALAELVSMSSGDNKQLQNQQIEEQKRELEQQLKDRPLLHAQEALDKETQSKESDDTEESDESQQQRSQVLRDDDHELEFLQTHLTRLHKAFYNDYDAKRAARQGSPPKPPQSHGHDRDAKLRRKSTQQDDGVDLSMVPDVGEVLDELKAEVLQDTVIVLSGLVPNGIPPTQSDIGIQAMSYGALIDTKVSSKVTHVVVSRERIRTQKAQLAAQIPTIKIVDSNWLLDSVSQWKHLDETPYMVHVDVKPGDVWMDAGSNASDEEDDFERPDFNIDWDVMHAEMDEFLASGTDDDDEDDEDNPGDGEYVGDSSDTASQHSESGSEAGESQDSSILTPGRKRKAGADDESLENGEDGSALAKRQRVSKDRGASKLSAVAAPDEEEVTSNNNTTTNNEEEDDLEDLEAAMERELAAAEEL